MIMSTVSDTVPDKRNLVTGLELGNRLLCRHCQRKAGCNKE